MEPITILVVFIIVIALIFDYTNGMHDAANSIATIVSTRVLSPGVAVAWAAFFNFIAFAVFGTAVAKMIGGGLIDLKPIPKELHLYVLLAGLIGASRDDWPKSVMPLFPKLWFVASRPRT